ncbi:MAG: phage tail assembly protein [Pseudomonadota bacterium]|nr:phage tail assembly protein [Pseudomonadota bacterium]
MTQEAQFETVDLDEPIQRGDNLITRITLRRPQAGELRGISLLAVMQMDTNTLITLLPRISDPVLTTPELTRMNLADIVQLATVVANFHVPKKLQEQHGLMTPS